MFHRQECLSSEEDSSDGEEQPNDDDGSADETLLETERREAENSDGEESNDESNSEDESATGSENEMVADANAVVPAAEVPASPEVYFRLPNTALFFLLCNPLITFGILVGTGQRR